MRKNNHRDQPSSRLWPSLGLLGFGLLALVFLIAVERPHWFSIRPVSGAAAAMSYAAEPSTPDRGNRS